MDVSEALARLDDATRRQFREVMIAWSGRQLEKREKRDPNSLEVAYVCKLLGDLHFNQGRFETALTFFERGIGIVERIDPNHSLVCSFCLAIGASLSHNGEDPEKCIPFFERALALKKLRNRKE